MSEDRALIIFAEKRSLLMDEARELEIYLDDRVFGVQEDERVLEVRLP